MLNIISLIADIATIGASVIVIYLFLTKRVEFSAIIRVLTNYSIQLTFSELNSKLDRLNELNADSPDHISDVIIIFNDLLGQIRGNHILVTPFEDIVSRVSTLCDNKESLTEARKRALVSELRELLRSVNVKNISDISGGS